MDFDLDSENLDLKSKDLSPQVVKEASTVRETFFLKRGDEVIAVEEKEAWYLLTQPQNVISSTTGRMRNTHFEFLGRSSGEKFLEITKKEKSELSTLKKQIDEKKLEYKRYYKTLDRFKFDELLEDSDERVKKVNKLLKSLTKEIDKMETEYFGRMKSIHKTAFDAELEVARGNLTMPADQTIFTPHAKNVSERNKIISSMPV